MLFAILFGAVDYWSAMIRIQQAEHLKNYYLDRARLSGWLTSDGEAELISKMDQVGFTVTQITGATQNKIPSPIKRNIADSPDDPPIIELSIETEFKESPFMLGFFLGKENTLKPKFYGKVVSEYAGP